ncbi:3520_t:CDS:2, partial [Cetraspora pellucida]
FCVDDSYEEFQMHLSEHVVKSYDNAAIKHNENLIMTSNFYFDSYEEFQIYLSKSVVKSGDNIEVECNDNSLVEHNDNSAEEYVENFIESVVDQNFYAESIQESTGSSNTL